MSDPLSLPSNSSPFDPLANSSMLASSDPSSSSASAGAAGTTSAAAAAAAAAAAGSVSSAAASSAAPILLDTSEVLRVTVSEPAKRGDGMDAHVVYRVAVQTTMPQFRHREFFSYRRYRDFERLHNLLVATYPGVIVPPIPDKGVIDRLGPGFDQDFIEARRFELQRMLRRIAAHPRLRQSPVYHLFLQATDDEWAEEKDKKEKKSRGVLQFLRETRTSITGTLPIEEWFEQARQHSMTLDNHLMQQRKHIERMAKLYTPAIDALRDHGVGLMLMASGVHDSGLQTALKHVGEAAEAVAHDARERLELEMPLLDDLFSDYLRWVGVMKDAIKRRENLMLTQQTCSDELNSKRATYDKMRAKHEKEDKLQKALDAVQQAEQALKEAKQAVDECTTMLQSELKRFDHVQSADFQRVLRRVVRSRIESCRASMELWESTVPAISLMTGDGLNDEHLPLDSDAPPATQ